jgi:hypothetical protein
MDKFMDSDDETMFAALMEEEAEIAVTNDEGALDDAFVPNGVVAPALMQSRAAEGRRLAAARASRGRGWKATAFRRLLRRRPIARRGGILALFLDEPKALPRYCLCRSAF